MCWHLSWDECSRPMAKFSSEETVRRLMDIPEIKGMKHSSLDRLIELERLALRDAHRPDFRIYTGNDLGIDMIEYGSDYLLGLATFAPEKFAERDRLWEAGDAGLLRAVRRPAISGQRRLSRARSGLQTFRRDFSAPDGENSVQRGACEKSPASGLGGRDTARLCPPAGLRDLSSSRLAWLGSSARAAARFLRRRHRWHCFVGPQLNDYPPLSCK